MLICAAALLAAWSWNRLHGRPAPSNPLALRLPVAPAREPLPPWSGAQIARLRAGLSGAFAPALAGASGWSLAVDGADGRTIYADRATHAVAPASVTKLIVAATALDVLGSTFRYRTIFASHQPIGDGGKLEGNLWFVGSGDPSLRSQDVSAGVGVLARAGLTSVTGGVAVDPSAMRGPELNPHWDPDDAGEDYAAPTNALSIDGDTIESSKLVDGVDERFWTPVRNVPLYAAGIVERLLRARGVAVGAPPVVEPAPLDSIVLWEHASQPLRALERHMLFFSDNHYAEQLLRTVGGEAGGTADDAGGLAAERRFLSERGIPVPGLRLEDGSGLSDGNRVAAITFARLLSDAELRGGNGSLYLLLPLGGKEGTLEGYDFAAALGRVRAKSGHLSGVWSLAGYVNTPHHGRIVFAFLIDGSPGDPDAAIVRAVNRLAQF